VQIELNRHAATVFQVATVQTWPERAGAEEPFDADTPGTGGRTWSPASQAARAAACPRALVFSAVRSFARVAVFDPKFGVRNHQEIRGAMDGATLMFFDSFEQEKTDII